MLGYSWEQQRLDIQKQINRFFIRKIHIAPRAFASFQCGAPGDSAEFEARYGMPPSVFEYSVLHSLLKCSPACATMLLKLGVELNKVEFPTTLESPAPLTSDTLEWIFRGVDAQKLVPTARKVRKARFLTEVDILISSLEASLAGTEPTEFGGILLKAAGMKEPPHIRGYYPHGKDRWKKCDTYLHKLIEQAKQIVSADPSHSLFQFVLFVDAHNDIRVRPFGTTTLTRVLPSPPLTEETTYVYRGGILQPINALLPELSDNILGQFEDLLNSTNASEQDFQKFFEKYSFFLTGLDFGRAHPQPILFKDEGSDLIPDFFLEKLTSGWDAIVDLKRPFDDMIARRKNRVYFKQHVHNAIAQLRYYEEWFNNPTNRDRFHEAYGIRTYRPKMVIVIGRDYNFRSDVERIRLLEDLPSKLELWTYDTLLNRAKSYLNLCRGIRDR